MHPSIRTRYNGCRPTNCGSSRAARKERAWEKKKKAAHIGFGTVTSEIELAIRPARGGSLPYLSLSGIEGDELGATGIFPTFCLVN